MNTDPDVETLYAALINGNLGSLMADLRVSADPVLLTLQLVAMIDTEDFGEQIIRLVTLADRTAP